MLEEGSGRDNVLFFFFAARILDLEKKEFLHETFAGNHGLLEDTAAVEYAYREIKVQNAESVPDSNSILD